MGNPFKIVNQGGFYRIFNRKKGGDLVDLIHIGEEGEDFLNGGGYEIKTCFQRR